MDIKKRFKNKTFLAGLIAAVVAFVYQIAGMFGFVPPITEDTFMQFVGIVLNILMGLGVFIDPTTAGISDKEV